MCASVATATEGFWTGWAGGIGASGVVDFRIGKSLLPGNSSHRAHSQRDPGAVSSGLISG